MNEPNQSQRPSLASTLTAEMEALEERATRAETENVELDKALALAQQDADTWKRRALEGESSRDRYAHFCIEIISRVTNLQQLSDIFATISKNLLTDARRVAAKPNGLPAKQVILPPEDQARLDNIVRTFGYVRPGEQQGDGDQDGK